MSPWRSAAQAPLVLVVDDQEANIQLMGKVLGAAGFDVMPALSGEQALQRVRAQAPDAILLDMRMPGMDGFGVLERLKHDPELADIPVLFVTAEHDRERVVQAIEAGAADYLTKPLHSPDELRMLAARLLSVKLIQNQNAILQEETQKAFPCGSVVTRNPAMQAALELATQVAPTDTTVLLLGESGTGKDRTWRRWNQAVAIY